MARVVGLFGLIDVFAGQRHRTPNSIYKIRLKSIAHPVAVRSKSSDISVFKQIFIENEYACLRGIPDVGLVIDSGANVGYSSIYFLNNFPQCRIAAIEPDQENFAMLQRNLAHYSDRVKLYNAGIWSHRTRLAIKQNSYRDGREWTRQVQECENGEMPGIDGIDLESILRESGYDRVSILKMDIEGAEAVVFSAPQIDWLDKIDVIAIELHDDSSFGIASDVFFSAIEGQNFRVTRSGELTICTRSDRIYV